MRGASAILICGMLVLAAVMPVAAQDTPASGNQPNAALEKVLDEMDAAAAKFRSTEADFVWEQYQKVVNDTDTQKGKVYFRRAGKDTEMMADISEPTRKFVLYSNGKVQVYQPKIEQVTVYPAGKNRADVESFLVLGFGGSGHELLKSYEVKYLGSESLNGVQAGKLNLVPKSSRVRGMFDHIVMWVDGTRGISLQQQVFEPTGDYRLAKYTNVKINEKIPESVFKLKTTGKTRFLSPQGE